MNTNTVQTSRLFNASCLALIVTAMSFAIRADLLGELGAQFHLSNEEMGTVASTAFWGFTLSMIFGGPLCDVLGMRVLLNIAFIGHLGGVLLTIFAGGFWSLYISTLLVGIANGMVEAACNPLIATLYPDNKTEKLNNFHVWFPGGIVLGGLLAYLLTQLGLGWQWKMAIMVLPTLLYGFMFLGKKFPQTERVSSGVSTIDMFKACKSILFIFLVACMVLTASTELGTNQWIAQLLGSVGVPSILLLVFINGFMAMGRYFAGPVVHTFSPSGVLFGSAILAFIGLIALSYAEGYMAFGAALIFAMGVCYFWPTMLGYVSENLPDTGALGLSIISGAGMLSVSFILPSMGHLYDAQTLAAVPAGFPVDVLKSAVAGTEEFKIWELAKLKGGSQTLRYISVLPLILIGAFGLLHFVLKKKLGKVGSPE